MIDKQELKAMFLAQPMPGQAELLAELNMAFYKLAGTVTLNTPGSAEQTIALRKLQEAQHYTVLALCRVKPEPTAGPAE